MLKKPVATLMIPDLLQGMNVEVVYEMLFVSSDDEESEEMREIHHLRKRISRDEVELEEWMI